MLVNDQHSISVTVFYRALSSDQFFLLFQCHRMPFCVPQTAVVRPVLFIIIIYTIPIQYVLPVRCGNQIKISKWNGNHHPKCKEICFWCYGAFFFNDEQQLQMNDDKTELYLVLLRFSNPYFCQSKYNWHSRLAQTLRSLGVFSDISFPTFSLFVQ